MNDEFYIGLKQMRATKQEYAELLHEFLCAVKPNYGKEWEQQSSSQDATMTKHSNVAASSADKKSDLMDYGNALL